MHTELQAASLHLVELTDQAVGAGVELAGIAAVAALPVAGAAAAELALVAAAAYAEQPVAKRSPGVAKQVDSPEGLGMSRSPRLQGCPSQPSVTASHLLWNAKPESI